MSRCTKASPQSSICCVRSLSTGSVSILLQSAIRPDCRVTRAVELLRVNDGQPDIVRPAALTFGPAWGVGAGRGAWGRGEQHQGKRPHG